MDDWQNEAKKLKVEIGMLDERCAELRAERDQHRADLKAHVKVITDYTTQLIERDKAVAELAAWVEAAGDTLCDIECNPWHPKHAPLCQRRSALIAKYPSPVTSAKGSAPKHDQSTEPLVD